MVYDNLSLARVLYVHMEAVCDKNEWHLTEPSRFTHRDSRSYVNLLATVSTTSSNAHIITSVYPMLRLLKTSIVYIHEHN